MRPDQDDPLGSAIRRTLQASRTDCPDAETIAAYAERSLASAERRGIERHLSDCARCRETLLMMSRAEEKGTATFFQDAKKGGSPLYWPWLAGAAAAALAVVVWMALPPAVRAPGPDSVAQIAAANPEKEKAVQLPSADADAPAPSEQANANKAPADLSKRPTQPAAAVPRRQERQAFREADRLDDKRSPEKKLEEAGERRRAEPSPAAPPAAEAPAAVAAPAPARPAQTAMADSNARDASALMARQNREYMIAAGPKAGTEAASAVPAITWRVWASGVVERTADGGKTWTRDTGVDAVGARAVASPTADVCWIVGDNGLILRFEAGRGWTRMTPPAQIAFVAIEASDARNATITAADSRRFTTTDGGETWK
jgi:hypothetical protein